MNWFDPSGEGTVIPAGDRPAGNSANGNAVMYAEGKILTCGGAEAFSKPEFPATTEAVIVEIDQAYGAVTTRVVADMQLARVYAYANVLPDATVLITGGASLPKEFSDATAHFQNGAPPGSRACWFVCDHARSFLAPFVCSVLCWRLSLIHI